MVSAGCQSSVSVFTVDYDAPISGATSAVRKSLQPLVSYANGTGNGTGELTFQILLRSSLSYILFRTGFSSILSYMIY